MTHADCTPHFRARWMLATLLAGLLLGCQPSPPETAVDTLHLDAFGTLVDISLWPAGQLDPVRVDRVLRTTADELHDEWHAWQPGTLQRFNEVLGQGDWVTIPPVLVSLVERSRAIEAATEGFFNVAIGELIAAWGFHQDEPAGPPPDATWLAAWNTAVPSLQDLEIDGPRARSHHPRLQLDFGAIAKGAAAAELMARLQALGVDHAIVNVGGDLVITGQPGDRPWNIGVRDPAGGVLGGLTLEARDDRQHWALFTSGTYERGYRHQGERIHHVLDPRSGRPARGLVSATILHDDPIEADAWATALLVAGPDQAPQLAAELGIRHWMLLDDDNVLQLSAAFDQRFTPTTTSARRYRIVSPDDVSPTR